MAMHEKTHDVGRAGFEDGVCLERRGATAVITLSNPEKRNAFYPEMRLRMTRYLKELGGEASVRCIIITGADGHFCAGADLSRVAQRPAPMTTLETRENMKVVLELLRAIAAGAKPVIAAVEGDAFGAGFSIAAACDLIVATPTSRFGAAFSKMSLAPDMGLLYSLPRRVGHVRASRLMMLSTPVTGEEGVRIGLVDELAEPGGALNAALEFAEQFHAPAPLSVSIVKSAMAGLAGLDDVIRMELDIVPLAISTEDHREAMAAFAEKRKPDFKAR